MPVCANCNEPYHEDYDGCPRCAKSPIHDLAKITSQLTTVIGLLALMLLMSLFAGCASFLGSTPGL
jgi:hypothetical protein